MEESGSKQPFYLTLQWHFICADFVVLLIICTLISQEFEGGRIPLAALPFQIFKNSPWILTILIKVLLLKECTGAEWYICQFQLIWGNIFILFHLQCPFPLFFILLLHKSNRSDSNSKSQAVPEKFEHVQYIYVTFYFIALFWTL